MAEVMDIDKLFNDMLERLDSVDITRRALVEKLKDQIMTIDISNDDSGAKMEAKMGLFKGFSDLLKDIENTAVTKTKMGLSKKSTETDAKNAANLTELLKATSLKTGKIHTPTGQDVEVGLRNAEQAMNFTAEELSAVE